jgi:hypothetical protein
MAVRKFKALKQCCNPLNVHHSTHFIKNLRHVWDWMTTNEFRKGREYGNVGID